MDAQLRQVVPPVEHGHQAGLDEPPQVAPDLAGGAAHDLPEPGGPHGGELADGHEEPVGCFPVDGLHVWIFSQPQAGTLRPAHGGMARGVGHQVPGGPQFHGGGALPVGCAEHSVGVALDRVFLASSLAQASTATTIWADGSTSWSGSS